MLSLQHIDGRNVWDILKLKVSKEQQSYVAGNDVSLIEAYISKTENGQIFPFGIYKDDVPVGFLMIGFGTDSSWDDAPAIAQNNYDLRRLMIDIKYQGRGYGKEALNLALEFIRTFPCGRAEYCWLSYEPENKVARDLYRSFGFVETGEKDGEELIAVLKLVSDVSEVSSTKELLDNGAVFSVDNEELLAQFFQAENMRDWKHTRHFLPRMLFGNFEKLGKLR